MRTRHRTPQVANPEPELAVARRMEYKGASIIRLTDGSNYAVLPDGKRIPVSGREEGMAVIDEHIEVVIPEQKPDVAEYPRGGCTKNPPESCPKRYQAQTGGCYWVDNIVCVFYCGNRINCRTYSEIMSNRSLNMRRLHYVNMAFKCPHCESDITVKGLDQWTYSCGSIADLHSNMYIKKCGQPAPTNRRRR